MSAKRTHSLPAVPSNTGSTALRQFLQALKERIEKMSGERGSAREEQVTQAELDAIWLAIVEIANATETELGDKAKTEIRRREQQREQFNP